MFVEQIENNQPVTVTNPDMTRYMMTLDEAVELVLFAFENGNQGDLFVQKAPAATIGTLAQAVVELKGNKDTKIVNIGTRHGEKLYEVLVTKEDMVKAEDLGDYYRIPADNRDLNYDRYIEKGTKKLDEGKEYNSHNTKRLDVDGMKKLLKKLDMFN